jgi:hypothetical protein
MGGAELTMFTVWGFLVGIFAVWLYAGIRPRYGAGQKKYPHLSTAWIGGDPGLVRWGDVLTASFHGGLDALAACGGDTLRIEDGQRHCGSTCSKTF